MTKETKKEVEKKVEPKKEKKVEKPSKDKELIKKLTQQVQDLSVQLEMNKIEFKRLQDDYLSKAKDMGAKAQSKLDDKINEFKTNFDSKLKESKKYAMEKPGLEIIQALEVFHSAIAVESTDPGVNAYQQGFKMIYSMFESALANAGITEIKTSVGDDFDPIKHEAIETEKDNATKITKVVKKGYKLYERIIKPTTVVIG